MTSGTENVGVEADADKDTVVASVRLDARVEKAVRRAAVERDTSRSEFMAAAAERAAREVLHLKRDEDWKAYLAAA